MSNNKYEECLIDLAPRLKKKGVEEYHDMAAKLCRMRVDEGTVREFALPQTLEDSKRTFALDLAE